MSSFAPQGWAVVLNCVCYGKCTKLFCFVGGWEGVMSTLDEAHRLLCLPPFFLTFVTFLKF